MSRSAERPTTPLRLGLPRFPYIGGLPEPPGGQRRGQSKELYARSNPPLKLPNLSTIGSKNACLRPASWTGPGRSGTAGGRAPSVHETKVRDGTNQSGQTT